MEMTDPSSFGVGIMTSPNDAPMGLVTINTI